MFPNWAKSILFLLVFMISGLVLAIIIDGLSTGTALTPLNTAVERIVVHLRTPFLTTLLVFVTRLGSSFFLSSVAVLVAVILFIRGRVYEAALFITVMMVTHISLSILKDTLQITRPGYGIIDTNGWSFPSGHTTVTTAFFFMLTHTFFGRMKTLGGRTVLILGSILGTVSVSFSRLYLGAHWTLDILGGIALGLMSVSFTILMFNVFVENRRSLRNRIK